MPVDASPVELPSAFPVDEGLLTTAATGDAVVVVAPTPEDGTDVVEVADVVEVDEGIVGEVEGGVEVDVVVGDAELVVVVVGVTAERLTTLKPSAPCPVTWPGMSPSNV